MGKIIFQMGNLLMRFFNKIIDQEARRVFEFNAMLLGGQPDEGGEIPR